MYMEGSRSLGVIGVMHVYTGTSAVWMFQTLYLFNISESLTRFRLLQVVLIVTV